MKHQKDSLKMAGVDTMLFYHQYCGECSIVESKTAASHCEVVDNSWTFIGAYFVYKQKGHVYSLKFNYCNTPVKAEIKNSQSLNYFVSIIPVLKKRNQAYIQRKKKLQFFPPTPVDGGYQDATLYWSKNSMNVSLNQHQKTDGYNDWKIFFWIDKEIKLMKLIDDDLKIF